MRVPNTSHCQHHHEPPTILGKLLHLYNLWDTCSHDDFSSSKRVLLTLITFVVYYRPQRSCGKVIFSQACVKNSVHGGGVSAPVHAGIHTHPRADNPRQTPPPPHDGHCNGRYASYWNIFLFQNVACY